MRQVVVTGCLLLAMLLIAPAQAKEEIPDSGDMAPGATYSYTFTEAYPDGHFYHCHPHPWMWAMVHVYEDGEIPGLETGVQTHNVEIFDNGDILDQDNMTYTPQHLSIEVGDTVVWTNAGTFVHTVSPGNPNDDDAHHDHGSHDHGEVSTPGVPVLFALIALALAAMARRQ